MSVLVVMCNLKKQLGGLHFRLLYCMLGESVVPSIHTYHSLLYQYGSGGRLVDGRRRMAGNAVASCSRLVVSSCRSGAELQ